MRSKKWVGTIYNNINLPFFSVPLEHDFFYQCDAHLEK